jgi:hypothetical protein
VVEADKAETAANKFKELIFFLKSRDDIFSNIITVYIKDIVEIRDIPRTAILTRIQSSTGEFPKSISRSLAHTAAHEVLIVDDNSMLRENGPNHIRIVVSDAACF